MDSFSLTWKPSAVRSHIRHQMRVSQSSRMLLSSENQETIAFWILCIAVWNHSVKLLTKRPDLGDDKESTSTYGL